MCTSQVSSRHSGDLKLAKRNIKNGKEKRIANRKTFQTKPGHMQEEDILAGKDLDSISPLIKRLLIDSFENHAKQEKSRSKRVAENRKCTPATYSKTTKYHDDQSKISTSKKWRNSVKAKTGCEIPSYSKSNPRNPALCTAKSRNSVRKNSINQVNIKSGNPHQRNLRRSQSLVGIRYTALQQSKSKKHKVGIKLRFSNLKKS